MTEILEYRALRAITAGVGIAFTLGACGVLPDSEIAYSDVSYANQEPSYAEEPSEFTRALAEGYLELARAAHAEDGNAWDASAYVSRSLRVQMGEDVGPLDPTRVRAVRADGSTDDGHDAGMVYAEVVSVIDGHRADRPVECAGVQLAYDNWIEEERERSLAYSDPEMVYEQLQAAIAACTEPLPEPPRMASHYVVLFAFDSAELDAAAMALVAAAGEEAKMYGTPVSVVGHTDRAGGDDYNLKLSLERAEAVASALVDGGLMADMVLVAARGESDPVEATDDGEPNDSNRRVQITVN